MQTITLTAGQISQIVEVGPGTRITSSGNGNIEWVAGALADAKNGSGTWANWPKGSSAGNVDTVRRMCIRATATGAMTVTLDESKHDDMPDGAYWDSQVVTTQTNATTGLPELLGPDGTYEMVNITGGKGAVGLINRAAVSSAAVAAASLNDNWLWFKLDAQYGTAYDKIVNSSTKLLTSELTLTANGTINPGMYTDNAGWMTPKGTGFLTFRGADATTPSVDGISSMFDMSALEGVGGFLMVFNVYIPSVSVGSGDDLVGASTDSNQTSYGGVRIYINSQQVLCALRLKGGSINLAPATQSGLSAGEHQVAFFFDGVNRVCNVYLDGAAASGGAASVPFSDDALGVMPGMEHNRGVRFLARPNNAAGATLGHFGLNDPLRRCNSMFFRRFERDVSADIPTLIADLYAGDYLSQVPYDWGQI